MGQEDRRTGGQEERTHQMLSYSHPLYFYLSERKKSSLS